MNILFLKTEATEQDPIRARLTADGVKVRHHERELLSAAVAAGELPAHLDIELATFAFGSWMAGLLRSAALYDRDLAPDVERLGDDAIDLLRSPAFARPT